MLLSCARALAFCILVASPLTAIADAKTKIFCVAVQEEFNKLTDQLPLKVDYMTSVVGVVAFYTSTECIVQYSYVINEEKFIAEFMEGAQGELSWQESVDYINSQEGRELLIETFKGDAKSTFKKLLVLPSIRAKVNYTSDGFNIDSFGYSMTKADL